MRTSLLNYTGYGMPDPARFAACLLIFAKNTRVSMSPGGFGDLLQNHPDEKIMADLFYIANTIPGSWEFVSYSFLIEDVSRAFTHQLVRTRTASYAQQTMQVLDVSDFDYVMGESIPSSPGARELYDETMAQINSAYKKLQEMGVAIQDARGVLPTNICTNIVAKMDLLTFVRLVRSRCGPRNADEMATVVRSMRDRVMEVHPWTALFLKSDSDDAAEKLDRIIVGFDVDPDQKNLALKMVDRMRRRD